MKLASRKFLLTLILCLLISVTAFVFRSIGFISDQTLVSIVGLVVTLAGAYLGVNIAEVFANRGGNTGPVKKDGDAL